MLAIPGYIITKFRRSCMDRNWVELTQNRRRHGRTAMRLIKIIAQTRYEPKGTRKHAARQYVQRRLFRFVSVRRYRGGIVDFLVHESPAFTIGLAPSKATAISLISL